MAEHKGMGTEDRLAHLDAALKECIQQISTLQEERQVEAELKEANKRLVCTLVCKQELVDELERDKQQLETEVDALVTRLDSVEKENAFLKCECCALERDLVLHLDSSKKVADLEEECQQRKLQGPPLNGALVAREPSHSSTRKIDILVDRLCDVEEENKALTEIIKATENQLSSSKFKSAQMAYRLAVIEAELKDVATKSVNINGSDQLCTGASKNSLMNHFISDSENQSMSKQIVPVLQATRMNGCWPWNVLHEIMEEHQLSKRSISELLEEINISLAPQSCNPTSGLLTWAPDQAIPLGNIQAKPGGSNLSRSICRMIELIEEISPSSLVERSLAMDEDQCHTDTNLEYSVHVFRWRNSELIHILRKFVLSCSLALNGSHGLGEFAVELTSLLEWAVANCITLEDASRVRDRIRKHFNLDRSKSESEIDGTSGDCQNVMTKMIKIQSDLQEENTWLNHKLRSMESANKELETKLRSAMENNELLMSKLEESKESIARLKEEVEDLHESKEATEDEMEHQKSINEDLDTQLTVAKVKQNELIQKLSSLEIELEDRHQCCEDLETTCLELQLQLQIFSRKGSPYQEEDQPSGWEMIPDCTKLSMESTAEKEKGNEHCSLRDRMLADNDASNIKEREMEKETQPPPVMIHPDKVTSGALAIVPMKKQRGGGFGFIRKMFLRGRKCSTKKTSSTLLQRNASTMVR